MNSCWTCKYWLKRAGRETTGMCDMVDSVVPNGKLTFEIVASADDDSGLQAYLITGEDFGCIHHASALKKENEIR